MLCDLVSRRRGADRGHRRDPAVVLRGADGPGEPGRRGPRGRLPRRAAGLGALVVFAGEVHAAQAVRKATRAPRRVRWPRTRAARARERGPASGTGRGHRAPPAPGRRAPRRARRGGRGRARRATAPWWRRRWGAGADGLVAVLFGRRATRRRPSSPPAAPRRPACRSSPACGRSPGASSPAPTGSRAASATSAPAGLVLRAGALPGRGTDRADGVPGGRLQPGGHGRRLRPLRFLAAIARVHIIP